MQVSVASYLSTQFENTQPPSLQFVLSTFLYPGSNGYLTENWDQLCGIFFPWLHAFCQKQLMRFFIVNTDWNLMYPQITPDCSLIHITFIIPLGTTVWTWVFAGQWSFIPPTSSYAAGSKYHRQILTCAEAKKNRHHVHSRVQRWKKNNISCLQMRKTKTLCPTVMLSTNNLRQPPLCNHTLKTWALNNWKQNREYAPR